MRNSIFIKIQAIPALQQIEQRDCKAEPHLEICPDSLTQTFQFANLPEQGENIFDQHPVVPLAAPTDFQVFQLLDFTTKTDVCQDDHFVGDGFDQRQKFLIRDIRRSDLPTSDEFELVCQNAEFPANNPLPGS